MGVCSTLSVAQCLLRILRIGMVPAACRLLHVVSCTLRLRGGLHAYTRGTIRSEEGVRCRQATKDKKEPTEKPLTG